MTTTVQALRHGALLLTLMLATGLATAKGVPGRVAVQKEIIDVRGQLRTAMLENKPQTDRDALMKQIADAEVEHFKGRNRCVEHLRATLSSEQFGQLSKLYLDGLR